MSRMATFAALALASAIPAPGQVWEVGEHAEVSGRVQAAAHFGAAVIAGDFDCDGDPDLIVAAPDYNRTDYEPDLVDSGTFDFFAGGPGGLGTHRHGIHFAQAGGHSGAALAAADFDADGCPELVVGRPGYGEIAEESGSVSVTKFDVDQGLWTNDGSLYQDRPSVPDTDEPFDHLGSALEVGNFNGDGYPDLAIGVPGEDLVSPEVLDAGAVLVVYGSDDGLTAFSPIAAQQFTEATGSLGGAQGSARFGAVLAAGDFDGDGFDDLAVGMPERDVDSGGVKTDAGQVVILFGSAGGLTDAGHLRLDDADFAGAIATGDRFGAALAAADFDFGPACLPSDCYEDLAIGIPGEPVSGQAAAGGVVIGYGSAVGPNALAFFTQVNLPGAVGTGGAEAGDQFGSVLVAAALDNRTGADLAIGVPGENLIALEAGVAHLLFGGEEGLGTWPDQLVTRRPGFESFPAMDHGDRFAAAMAFADFDLDGYADGAFGIPGGVVSGLDGAGRVQVLYGAVFADGFEGGSSSVWSVTAE